MRHQATVVVTVPPVALDYPASVLIHSLHVEVGGQQLRVGPEIEQEGLAQAADSVVDHLVSFAASFIVQASAASL